jgi:hypothetical protein
MGNFWKLGVATMVAAMLMAAQAPSAVAGEITCLPTTDRVAKLNSAESCTTKGDNFNINDSDTLNEVLGASYSWVKEGTLTSEGTNDLLTIDLLTGAWGGNQGITGTWAINPTFWDPAGLGYTIGAITMHVGGGNGNPDAFAWIITPGATSGTFSYTDLDGKGGGLSNLFLFGTEPRTTTTTTNTTTTNGTPTTTNGTPTTTDGGPTGVPEPNVGLLSAIGLLSVVGLRLFGRKAGAQNGR